VVNRKVVSYQSWCGRLLITTRGVTFPIPSYLFKDLDKHVWRNLSRFRLHAHNFRVESCKWLSGSNLCDKCSCNEVQDEKHLLFFCRYAEVCELRTRYKDLFADMFRPLHAFAQTSDSEFALFLAIFHSITDSEKKTT